MPSPIQKKVTLIGAAAAVAAGTAISKAAKRSTEEHSGPENKERFAARGACVYAIDNLWFEAMTPAAKNKFNYDISNFYKACGWPE